MYPALTLRNARLKRDEAARTVALGHSPAQRKQLAKVAADDEITVAEFGERFFREVVAKDFDFYLSRCVWIDRWVTKFGVLRR